MFKFILMVLFFCNSTLAQTVDKVTTETIMKGLIATVPNLPKIDEIKATPLPGIFEVRHSGTELFYSNKDGSYIIQGSVIDTKNKKNLTQDRIDVLTAVDFKKLPFKDAFAIVKGNGKRKIALFEDPNCGYCKQFEKDLEKLNDVTLYMFLFPILGQDSINKSNDIWCAKYKKKVWTEWMVNNIKIPAANCPETPIMRNVAMGKNFRLSGTPSLIFEDGYKISGTMTIPKIEEKLNSIKK